MRLLACREPLCEIMFENIVWYYSENNAPHHLKKFHLLKAYQILKTLKMNLRL